MRTKALLTYIGLSIALIAIPVVAQIGPTLFVQEQDGTPNGMATRLKFDNGTVTQSGSVFDITNTDTDTFADIEVDGAGVSTNAPTLDFDGTNFTLAESPTDDFDVTIDDDGHNHTGASLSGIDISDDTNLAVSSPIDLTDDTVGLDETADVTITGHWTFNDLGTGANGAYDLTAGGTYAGMKLGNVGIYSSSFSASGLDLDKAVLFRQEGALGVGNDPGIEFAWMEQGNTIRMAIPESGAGNATAFIRSGTFAGPYSVVTGNDIVLCDTWSTYDANIDCDTGGTGADVFVQDDLEVEGEIFSSGTIHLDADDANQLTIGAASQTAARSFTFPDDEVADTELLVGNGAGTFTFVPVSGDGSLSNAGALSVTDTFCTGSQEYLDGTGTCDTINGVEDLETPTDDGVLVGNGSTFDTKVIPDCDNATDDKLLYDITTNAFTCGVDQDGGGADTFATIEVDGTPVSTAAPTLDFDGTNFSLTESPTDDFDVTIDDDGHNHTGASLSSIDISDDTNLAVSGVLLDLTGDTLSVNEGTMTDAKMCIYESTGTQLICNGCIDCLNATEIQDVYLSNGGDSSTGNYDFGGSGGFEIPNSAAPTVNADGEVAVDTSDDQFVYYSGSKRVIAYTYEKCINVEDLAADDDNFPILMNRDNITVTGVGCSYVGTGSTVAQISLEDGAGNAMTHTTPTCVAHGTNANYQGVTVGNALVGGEIVRFDVDNAVDPETDTYTFCITYTVDAQ